MQNAIKTENLTRTYQRSKKSSKKKWDNSQPQELVALGGVDLNIHSGELFGLLGPNGAGKTTLIKILTTLLAPTSGKAFVDGLDVVTQAREIRPRINIVSGGESCGYGVLNVEENLWLFSQIYGIPTSIAQERIQQMLEIVGLQDKARTRVSQLSTGQRQKMNFCRGFITDPKILFLDEPTLGLDVNAARSIRQFVRDWLREKPGRTLLLTTHYMMEAEELCDRLAIIDHGKLLTCGTPNELKQTLQQFPQFQLVIELGNVDQLNISTIPGVKEYRLTPLQENPDSRSASMPVNSVQPIFSCHLTLAEEAVIGQIVQAIVSAQGKILQLQKHQPTLEDAFVQLVGHRLESGEQGS